MLGVAGIQLPKTNHGTFLFLNQIQAYDEVVKLFMNTSRSARIIVTGCIVMALTLAGCSAPTQSANSPQGGVTVDVPVMWVGTQDDGTEVGGVEITQVWTGKSSSPGYSVDLSTVEAQGAGAAWQAASASAATVATLFNGSDPAKLDIRFTINSPIDGPSAGGILTVALMASMRNLKLNPEITMTGTISPDGSIGPIGGALSKVTAAQKAGYQKAIIPAANQFTRDPETKETVDLVEYGEKIGITVVPVFQLSEAFTLLTGEDLFPEASSSELKYRTSLSEQRSVNVSNLLTLTSQAIAGNPSPEAVSLYAEAQSALSAGDLNLASGLARESYLSINRVVLENRITSATSDISQQSAALGELIATTKDKAVSQITQTTQRKGLTDSQYASMPEMLLGVVTAESTLTALSQALPSIKSPEEMTKAIGIYADQATAVDVFYELDLALLNLVQGPKEIESENPIAFLSEHTNFLIRSGQANMNYLADVMGATKKLDNDDLNSFQTTFPILVELDATASEVPQEIEGLSSELTESAYALALYVTSGALVSESQALGLFNTGLGEEGDLSENIEATHASINAALESIFQTASVVDSEGWDTSYPLAQAEAGADFANNQLDESSSTNNVARGLTRLWAASIAVFLMKAAPE
jgi:hypothetical protein